MGAYATNLEFPLGSHLRGTIQHSLKKNILFCLRNTEHAASLSWLLRHLTVKVILSCFCPECQYNCFLFVSLFRVLQVSVQPQKTSPTRLRTCGQSAAQTLEGRTLWPVQMGRSQATVGECHIPARLAKPSVHCLSARNSVSQSYQSLSLLQLPPS